MKMNRNAKFIRTQDVATANLLRDKDFQELPKQGKYFVFINDIKKMNFDYDASKVSFSNVMMF